MVLSNQVAVPPKNTNISFKQDRVYVIENISNSYLPKRKICLDARVSLLELAINEQAGLGDDITKKRLEKAKRESFTQNAHLMNGMRTKGIEYFTKLREKGFKYLLASKPNTSQNIQVINELNIKNIVDGYTFEEIVWQTQQAFALNNGQTFSISVYGLNKIFENTKRM